MHSCGCQHYTNDFLYDLNILLRQVHDLARVMIAERFAGVPLRVAIYGAGTTGWLANAVFAEYPELTPVMYLDQSADALQSVNKELRMFRAPALPVRTPEAFDPATVDVVVCAVNPAAHAAVLGALDARCPNIPKYFMNYDEGMPCVHTLGAPVLLVTASRCGSIWFWEMCRYASFYNGFSEVVPVTPDNLFDYDMPGRMLPGQYTVSHHRLTPEILSLVESGAVRAAFLYRDPRDIAVSGSFFSQRREPAQVFRFDAEHYREVVEHIREWTRLPQVLQMRFEDLKADTPGVFGAFCDYAGWTLPPGVLERIVETTSFRKMSGRREGQEDRGSHFRKGVSGDWKNHFDDRARDFAREVSGELLVELGYEPDLDW